MRHRFPAEGVCYAVWLYFHFTLSLRDVEEMFAQSSIYVGHKGVFCWTIKFDPQIAGKLQRRTAASSAY